MLNNDLAQATAFLELIKSDPDKAREILLSNPATLKELQDLDKRYLAAEKVSVEGFGIFNKAVHLRELSAIDKIIVSAFVWAYENKKGVMEELWRGYGKSVLLLTWVAYITGARPVGSSTFLRINEKSAQKSGATIAEIIKTNPGWQEIFPNVVPDEAAGWSAENGYHVKDMNYINKNSYEKWLQLCLADHLSEPSLACGGVGSGIVIGTHPTNGSWIDDLHDESNTRSRAEMEEIVAILKGNIISTWFGRGGSPAIGVACTPWSDKDAYTEMMATGLFKKVSIPIFVKEVIPNHPATKIWEKNAKEHTVFFEPYGHDVILTFPESFPLEKVLEMYYSNPARFGQMYLVDIETLKGLTLNKETLGIYPVEKIDPSWPVYFGVDFASTTDKIKGDTDYFALSIGSAIPGGGIVLTGGYIDRVSMHTALAKMQALYELYRPVMIGVEKLGSGRQFIEQLMYSTRLPILPLPYEGSPLKSKGQKFETILDSAFSTGRMWISSKQDEFIKTFIEQWVSWDGGLQKSRTGHDDALDSLYILSLAAQGQIMQAPAPGAMPFKKSESHGLMASYANHKGY